jgi:ribonuclease PH
MARNPNTRTDLDHRPIDIKTQVNLYAEGSVLISCGNTQVLCTASIENKVADWLKGKGKGWITAEYSMLPRSTHTRSKRDREKVSGRTQEIQRLIARALRSCVDLSTIGERTITIDCDVLQADGGTRTTSITGGCIALGLALKKLKEQNPELNPKWVESVSAISIGIKEGKILVDLDYNEDSSCDVDMNFVITENSKFVEVQGTAENKAFDQKELETMTLAAQATCRKLAALQATHLK